MWWCNAKVPRWQRPLSRPSESQSTGAHRTIPGYCRRAFMPLDEGKGTPPPQRLSCVFERNALGHDLHHPTNVNT